MARGSLGQVGPITNSLDFSKDKELDHLEVIGALKSLQSDNYVTVTSRHLSPPQRTILPVGVPGSFQGPARSYAARDCAGEKSALWKPWIGAHRIFAPHSATLPPPHATWKLHTRPERVPDSRGHACAFSTHARFCGEYPGGNNLPAVRQQILRGVPLADDSRRPRGVEADG